MALETRLAKLEGALGADPLERWVRSLSDDELDATITEIGAQLRVDLAAMGFDLSELSNVAMVELAMAEGL